ncbi:hypothetical protein [Mobiluncus mulieris]|uniref:hypothetical protein n=1 Tax=Mobiluncus mulieris TaxID=2052 RepID=UPI0020928AE9|nr:hypothetical protein [Mobiluncus mulieris]
MANRWFAQMHGRHAHGPHELATRISGSADLFASIVPELDRGPGSSINFVCAHDGFTLADLVSYNHKHNEANGKTTVTVRIITTRGTTNTKATSCAVDSIPTTRK